MPVVADRWSLTAHRGSEPWLWTTTPAAATRPGHRSEYRERIGARCGPDLVAGENSDVILDPAPSVARLLSDEVSRPTTGRTARP